MYYRKLNGTRRLTQKWVSLFCYKIIFRGETMDVKNIRVSDIKPYARNQKKHPAEQVKNIATSIKKYGFVQPVVLDMNNEVIIGHGRLLAAKQLKLEEVPCVYAENLTEEQIRELRIIDNKLNESEWEWDFLREDLGELDFSDFDIDFGIKLDDEDTEVVEDEPVEVDEVGEPTAKLGDVYQLGRHRLMCGDSTVQTDVDKLMNGQKADMLLTDPPYNVAYEGKTKEKLTIQNDSMDNDSFRQFLRDAFSTADSAMKEGAVFYIWHADSEGYNFRGACFDVGWKVRQCIIWNKNSMVMGRQDYQWKHEPCLYGWKDGAGHLWASDRKQTTVINWDRPTKADIHPTMKPVGLFDYQIKNNTKGGDIVLDLFNGSGTTIMACEQNGRTGYAMELDPRYVDATVKRWETFTGEKAVLLNG